MRIYYNYFIEVFMLFTIYCEDKSKFERITKILYKIIKLR